MNEHAWITHYRPVPPDQELWDALGEQEQVEVATALAGAWADSCAPCKGLLLDRVCGDPDVILVVRRFAGLVLGGVPLPSRGSFAEGRARWSLVGLSVSARRSVLSAGLDELVRVVGG